MSDHERGSEAALAALLTRRSVSPRRLAPPGPENADIERMLQVAMRGPDHGGLRPWRVIEVARGERERRVSEDEAGIGAGVPRPDQRIDAGALRPGRILQGSG